MFHKYLYLQNIQLCKFLLHMQIYTEITEVNLSAFVYRLFHEDFSSIDRMMYADI